MATADPGNASVSRRAYFYALPYPLPPSTPVPYSLGLPSRNPLNLPETPLEPTHTLVLTSARKQFVDIRVFKPILPEHPELPNAGGPRERYVGLCTLVYICKAPTMRTSKLRIVALPYVPPVPELSDIIYTCARD